MDKLNLHEKEEIRNLLERDNQRIEDERFRGDILAKRASHLKPSVLARFYGVTPSQIRTAAKGLL